MSGQDLRSNQEEVEKLVLEAQKGSHEAFAKIYDIFVDPVYRYVFYRVEDSEAEDLVETIFIRIWENIRKYRKGKTFFSSWVFKIAHNLVVDHYRVSKGMAVQELDASIPDHKREHNPIHNTENSLDQNNLKRALSKLKKQYQEIIIYKFINEFSNVEIAQILKKSEGSLRILQFRALKALKKELQETGGDYHF